MLATGYKGQEYLVRKLFGERGRRRVGPIWGFGEGQELRNMFTRTAQPGSVVHRRQPGAVPHLLEIPRAADQGDRAWIVAARGARTDHRPRSCLKYFITSFLGARKREG